MPILKKPLREIDGISCYTKVIPEDYDDYHAIGLENINDAEKEHFWFISRRERIIEAISKQLASGSSILEVGGGTGFIAKGLKDNGYEVAVGEIHLSGLRLAKKNGISQCYQFDLFDPPFESEFDAIGMFDVLEHLEEDIVAIRKVSKMLKPDGKLFITVPSHQWLWSREDAIAAHKRRYSKQELINTIKNAGMELIEIRFFFISILPLLFLRHLFNRDNNADVTDEELNAKVYINPLVNNLLLKLTRLENRLSWCLPNMFGGSLLCVVEKKQNKEE